MLDEYTPFEDDPTDKPTVQAADTPEKRLCRAILEEAIREVRLYGHNRNYGVSRRKFQELREWFFADDDEWVFSFRSIALFLDLSPETLRRAIFQQLGSGICGRLRS